MKNDHTGGTFSVWVRTLPPSVECDFQMFLMYQGLTKCQAPKIRIPDIISRNCVCGGIRLLKNWPNLVMGAGLPIKIARPLPPANSPLGFGGSIQPIPISRHFISAAEK
jgi:hypothetical protein